jgi:hypothetical protein
MFWIRIGFNADPGHDLAFYLNAIRIRIQGAKPMRISIRFRILVRLLSAKKFNFYMKIYLK